MPGVVLYCTRLISRHRWWRGWVSCWYITTACSLGWYECGAALLVLSLDLCEKLVGYGEETNWSVVHGILFVDFLWIYANRMMAFLQALDSVTANILLAYEQVLFTYESSIRSINRRAIFCITLSHSFQSFFPLSMVTLGTSTYSVSFSSTSSSCLAWSLDNPVWFFSPVLTPIQYYSSHLHL